MTLLGRQHVSTYGSITASLTFDEARQPTVQYATDLDFR